jgi:hypothetical protein
MLNRRQVLNISSALLAFWCLTPGVEAQSFATWQADGLKTEIYFGSDMGAGQSVTQQAWEEFVNDIVVPRFPAGLTIMEALGRGPRTTGGLTLTRVLIVVHPSGDEADARLSDIKAEYKKRFGSAGVFHIDQPVRSRNQ